MKEKTKRVKEIFFSLRPKLREQAGELTRDNGDAGEPDGG